MLSEFLVSHPENPFFQLSHSEWKAAIRKHPELLEKPHIEYIERSASGSIQVGYDGYFDNDAVISQFVRLFKMLSFKKAYKEHSINIIVDNARTHSAKAFSLEGFGMKPGTRCAIDRIQYMDENGHQQTIDCYFTNGANKGKSKGLLILAKELQIKVPPDVKLKELKRLLSGHKAFQNVGRLYCSFVFLIISSFLFCKLLPGVKTGNNCKAIRCDYYVCSKVPL